MSPILTARADVATADAARYAKQLVLHLGRKVEFTIDGATSSARFGDATGRIQLGEGVLTLLAESPDPDSLARVQDILGRQNMEIRKRNMLTDEDLGKFQAPALVLWTTKDPSGPVGEAERIASLIPNARLAVMDNCGHSVRGHRDVQQDSPRLPPQPLTPAGHRKGAPDDICSGRSRRPDRRR